MNNVEVIIMLAELAREILTRPGYARPIRTIV
jgi:hypothetical protein